MKRILIVLPILVLCSIFLVNCLPKSVLSGLPSSTNLAETRNPPTSSEAPRVSQTEMANQPKSRDWDWLLVRNGTWSHHLSPLPPRSKWQGPYYLRYMPIERFTKIADMTYMLSTGDTGFFHTIAETSVSIPPDGWIAFQAPKDTWIYYGYVDGSTPYTRLDDDAAEWVRSHQHPTVEEWIKTHPN